MELWEPKKEASVLHAAELIAFYDCIGELIARYVHCTPQHSKSGTANVIPLLPTAVKRASFG